MDKEHLKGRRNKGVVWACLFIRIWYRVSGKTGLRLRANTYTRGAGRMKAGSEPERGNAHVVFSAAKQQGGAECHSFSKYVRHAIGESRPFCQENFFFPKKTPKNSLFWRQWIRGILTLGGAVCQTIGTRSTSGVPLKSLGYNGSN